MRRRGLGTGIAHADTGTALYVDAAAGCSDTGPGSQAEPFCQIQPAADAAAPGDTVHVARNTTRYAPVTIRSAGTADAPVTFVAAPGDNSATSAAAVVLSNTSTPPMTFSGAQYVDVSGFNLAASETSALVVARSQHITYDTGWVSTGQAAPSTTETITVDGSSSGISLTRLHIAPESGGLAFAGAAGAQDITPADDVTDLGGGISATGATGMHPPGRRHHRDGLRQRRQPDRRQLRVRGEHRRVPRHVGILLRHRHPRRDHGGRRLRTAGHRGLQRGQPPVDGDRLRPGGHRVRHQPGVPDRHRSGSS